MIKKFSELNKKLKSKIFFNYNIGKHTWFRTGGNAKYFIIIENSSELEIILNEIVNNNFYVLGSGSNLLVREGGYNGIVIKLGKGFNSIEVKDNYLEVGASILDINLSNYAFKNNIFGFEFFSGIPGSIGGAVKMNAGCFGSETKDILKYIEILGDDLKKKIINKNDINLNYRHSDINDREIITKAFFNLKYENSNKIKERINFIKNKRNATQPIKNKTSGSTFKNPGKLYAAKLIEEAGCKGMKYGNAIVSDHHANFLINLGNATANDIESLGNIVIEKVYNKFNIELEWEVKIIGEK